jgi:arylsulfatase A-like enzyme
MRWLLLVATTLGLGLCAHTASARQPNVVFILADDLGYTDVACYGSKYYETPNIDRMAQEGVRFTQGYTCGPNCQPTRAALMSGQYGPRTGVYTVGGIDRFNWQSRPLRPVDNVSQLPLDKVTLADAMKKAGYATGMFGKWHLGNDEQHHPSQRGFDEAIESSGVHFDFKTDPPTEYPKDQYLADFLTDRAVDFIDRHKEQPFFLYLPHFGVHAPHQAKPELIERFKAKPPAGKHRDPAYAAMIASVDESVGRVLAKLEELGLDDDTLVIFSSDNGGVGGYKSVGLDKNGITDNAPLKGGKGTLYEGGIRVPYIFRWPGRIKPGRTSETPIISVDLYPTLLELAGARREADQQLDGVSYLPVLTGKRETLDRDGLYWHFPGYLGFSGDSWRTKPVSVVRSDKWKLRENLEDGSVELYDLEADVSETKNLASDEPETVKRLRSQLAAWREEVGAKMPTANDAVASAAEQPRNRRRNRQGRDNREGRGDGAGRRARRASAAE